MKYPRFFVPFKEEDSDVVCFRLDSPNGPVQIFYKMSSSRVTDIWISSSFDQSVKDKLIKEIPPSEAALIIG